VSRRDPVRDTVNDTLNDRQRWFVGQLEAGRAAAAEDIMDAFSVSLSTARRDIRGLTKAGVVRFVGPPKTGRYEITDTPSES
jgi:predicted DNA-binding transcriptional regulator YafY